MIAELVGFDSDYIILGLLGIVLILLILTIINMIQLKKVKNKYNLFMKGKNGKSLEDTLLQRLNQVDDLIAANDANEKNIKRIFHNMKYTFQKYGIVKYNAFNEMGGKLSFSLALLNEKNNGFIINAVHSREGCYTYVKEIIDGTSVIVLAEEEQEALDMATGKIKRSKK